MKKYLANDPVNGIYELFETIEEARNYLTDCFLYEDEGYHPDTESFEIYELIERVKITVVDEKSNYKYASEENVPEDDQEAIDNEDYWKHSYCDEICTHEFVKV